MNLVCLISRQAMANLLPVLMYIPGNVFLLSTPEEISCARHLQSLLIKKGIKVYLYDDISAYDDINLKKRLDYIYNKFNGDIFLNLTGGTKLMALSAYEYVRQINKPAFYCNTENKQIIHILPEKNTEDIKANLTIDEYLAAYGYKIVEEKPTQLDIDYEKLFTIIENNNLLNEFIEFTLLVRKGLNIESYKTINSKKKNFSFQKTSANLILDLPLIQPQLRFKFFTKDFLFGDWLEYYVYFKYKFSKSDEIKLGVKVVSENGILNELDVIALKDFKLFLISCKSGIPENTFLYELETLRIITSGTFGRGVAVVSSTPKINIVNRAKELSITLISDLNRITI